MGNALVEAARAVAPVASAHADESEQGRRLAAPVVEALRDAGLLRLCVPAAYGGPEADPMTLVEVVETVAAGDGAAGWCTMIASTTSSMACFLEPAVADAVYGDPRSVTGGVFAPNGEGERIDGGWRVRGRWQWGSGTQHCDWITGGTRTSDGGFHLMYFPSAEVTFHDTWHAMGLKGTGSLDFSVDGAVVPDGWSVQPGVSTPQLDTPLARFPNFNLLGCGVAAASLGIARRAIDEVVALAQGKTPLFSSKTLARSSLAQMEVARAEADLGGARAFLLDELHRVWEQVVAGGRPSVNDRARVRLAAIHAAERSAQAVDRCYTVAGGSSVFLANPLQRCFRDAHTATQHLMVSGRVQETIGKVLLGVDADVSAL